MRRRQSVVSVITFNISLVFLFQLVGEASRDATFTRLDFHTEIVDISSTVT